MLLVDRSFSPVCPRGPSCGSCGVFFFELKFFLNKPVGVNIEEEEQPGWGKTEPELLSLKSFLGYFDGVQRSDPNQPIINWPEPSPAVHQRFYLTNPFMEYLSTVSIGLFYWQEQWSLRVFKTSGLSLIICINRLTILHIINRTELWNGRPPPSTSRSSHKNIFSILIYFDSYGIMNFIDIVH